MKVILLNYVYKARRSRQVIDVAAGFARNFLIPRGLAVKAPRAIEACKWSFVNRLQSSGQRSKSVERTG